MTPTYIFRTYTFIVLCIIVFATNCFQLPDGSFSVQLTTEHRGSPGIAYTSRGVFSIDKGQVANVHMISEQRATQHIFEFNSANRGKGPLVTYVDGNDEKASDSCYYLSSLPMFSIESMNMWLKNLQPVNRADLVQRSLDKTVNTLIKQDVNVFVGRTVVEEEEDLLLITDQMDSPMYIIGQNVLVTVNRFLPAMKHEVYELMSLSKALKSKCISLEKEIDTSGVLKTSAEGRNKQVNAEPWFYDVNKSCDTPHIKDDSKCVRVMLADPPQKVCVFLHGAGEVDELPVADDLPNYWGNIKQYTSQCKEHLFIRRDTKNAGWDTRQLQIDYCSLAAYHNKTVDNTSDGPAIIKDTIIFSHSMGNLILAAGLKNGYCKLDESSSWYGIDAPYRGSKASQMVQTICRDYYNNTMPISLSKLYGYVATKGGYCDEKTGRAHYAYNVLTPDYCNERGECLRDLELIIKKHVKGLMCGLSPVGLYSEYSIMLQVLSTLVGYSEENDGMLGISSCQTYHSGEEFTTDFKSNFYRSYLNHADGTCRMGNSLFYSDRQPCSYYSNKY